MQHHAYLYEGSQDQLELLASSARKEFGFEGDNNPDLHVEAYEKFGIDDAHELTRDAQLKSVSGKSLFVLGIASINTHAQQALLKLLEEPQQGVIFILLTPPGILLPTVQSRLMTYPNKLEERETLSIAEAKIFLKNTYKARSAHISALLKDEENTKERVRGFVNALELVLYKKFETSHGNAQLRESLEDISKIRSYVSDQSPSLKMLLEHLAATLPQA